MKRLHTLLLSATISAICFIAVISSGCSKSKVKWLYYDETHCDRWEYAMNNEQLKDNFTNYYKTRGVKIFEVEIFSDINPDQCIDCTCKTGRRFKAKVSRSDAKALRGDGFYE